MNVRLEHPWTEADRTVQAVAITTVVIAVLGMLLLVRLALTGGTGYVTVHVDNRAGLALNVDAVDAGGAAQGLGTARARALTQVDEVVDQGRIWTFVAAYGDREVFRQSLTRDQLAGQGWTVQVPAPVTNDLERAGFR
ncbi:MAG TPA: hypothetical protein VG276_14575 [Actinomycetes bacterium]|jgi:hypothetical protein|nr:hypothetical protein [Actinomycetes bacterium]